MQAHEQFDASIRHGAAALSGLTAQWLRAVHEEKSLRQRAPAGPYKLRLPTARVWRTVLSVRESSVNLARSLIKARDQRELRARTVDRLAQILV